MLFLRYGSDEVDSRSPPPKPLLTMKLTADLMKVPYARLHYLHRCYFEGQEAERVLQQRDCYRRRQILRRAQDHN